jgi:hypothetical protein
MNQTELLNWFKKEYSQDPEQWFSKKQISHLFPEEDKNAIGRKVNKLYAFGFLEVQNQEFPLVYKVKKEIYFKDSEFKSPLNKDITTKELRDLENV